MEGSDFSYSKGFAAAMTGGVIGLIVKHMVFRSGDSVMDELGLLVMFSAAWPIALPAGIILAADGAINGASWNFQVSRSVTYMQ